MGLVCVGLTEVFHPFVPFQVGPREFCPPGTDIFSRDRCQQAYDVLNETLNFGCDSLTGMNLVTRDRVDQHPTETFYLIHFSHMSCT